jgi:riboflavin transporter FmnP
LQFFGIIIAMFIIAYIAEKIIKKRNNDTERVLTTRKIAVIGVFSAIAAILHAYLKFPVVFIAPAFLEMDLAELPVLIAAFAYGPVAGVVIEFCKILLKLILTGTTTAFVGELANFVISCSYILPASIIYAYYKNKKSAIIGCIAGTLCITVFGAAFNALYLIPTFARMFMGNNIDIIIGMGNAINSAIDSVWTLTIFAIVPFNLLKGTLTSLVAILIYKKLSPVLKKR